MSPNDFIDWCMVVFMAVLAGLFVAAVTSSIFGED